MIFFGWFVYFYSANTLQNLRNGKNLFPDNFVYAATLNDKVTKNYVQMDFQVETFFFKAKF